MLVYNGGGYDRFVDDVLATDNDGRSTVQAYSFAQTLADEEGGESTESTDEPAGQDDAHGTVNEHVWYDVTVAEVTAYAIADRLGSLDPDNAATYTANARNFAAELAAVRDITAQIAVAHPDAPVVATEPIAHYLIEAADLQDATPDEFQNAAEEDTDPSPAAFAATRDLITSKQVRALVYNIQTQDNATGNLRAAAQAAGIPVVEVTETLPENTTYLDWLTTSARDLADALADSPA